MADEDEIDILGDFSFNSCLAQNSQGIPSCSDREDTVHPEWLLDSTLTNWYDKADYRPNITSKNAHDNAIKDTHTTWTVAERNLLAVEMHKYGRDVKKIAQALTTKTEAEIQALIEAEYGIRLETAPVGFDKVDHHDVPPVIQEEIVTDDITDVISLITTASPTIQVPKVRERKKKIHRLKKGDLIVKSGIHIDPAEIYYEDDMIVGSMESVSNDEIPDSTIRKRSKEKATKMGNHRRRPAKYSRSKFKIDVFNAQRKKSDSLADSSKNPRMQIILGSGQALPLSEGEQVIKIEKKDSESDIEIDVDSDDEGKCQNVPRVENKAMLSYLSNNDYLNVQVPLDTVRRRRKKINLDGGGGCTISHTAAGDVYAIGREPRKVVRKLPTIKHTPLVELNRYSKTHSAPYTVLINVSAMLCMDSHGHRSRCEVMGLVGGEVTGTELRITHYKAAAATAASTHCDMCPVSQAAAAEFLLAAGAPGVGWHHSHPRFPASPSARDVATQAAFQRSLPDSHTVVALITSQHWPLGRTASQYRCFRVEREDGEDLAYQLSVKLMPDLTLENLDTFISQLRELLTDDSVANGMPVDMRVDMCPEAGITYLEKCISSCSHHMRSAGYADEDPIVPALLNRIRQIFR